MRHEKGVRIVNSMMVSMQPRIALLATSFTDITSAICKESII